jgi:DnaJ-class molecular chaperone
MQAKLPSKEEIDNINKAFSDLNHYQVLKLKPLATEDEVREAFHREAIQFHPDQFSHEQDPELRESLKKAYMRIVDAYRILSHEDKRKNYDFELQGGQTTDDPNAKTSFKPSAPSAGDKFFRLAEKAFANGDMNSAKMNIQIAIGSDAENLHYQHLKAKIDAASPKKK